MNTITGAMSAEDYHADKTGGKPSLSSSIAKILIQQSPMHAWMAHPKLNPRYVAEESARFDIGSAAHALLLEGADRMCVLPFDDYRKKDAQEQRDAARKAGKLPVLEQQYEDVQAMVVAAKQFISGTELADVFDRGKPELTATWIEDCGIDVHCKARIDWLTDDRKIIVEYKTCDDARPETFIRQIGRLNYDLGLEWYVRAVEETCQISPTALIVAQECAAPYSCSLVGLSNSYREVGKAKCGGAIDKWAQCMKSGKWPAYNPRIHFAEAQTWQIAAMESGEYVL